MKAAGLSTVPQQSNMTEWLAYRKYLDEQSDQHCGWEDIFHTVLGAATVYGQGSKPEELEMASGLTQCFTAQSMATDALMSVPWASGLMTLSRVDLDSLWIFFTANRICSWYVKAGGRHRAHDLCDYI